jgi:hypothetical protein
MNSFDKETIGKTLVCLVLIFTVIFTGGILSYHCIIPLVLMIALYFFFIKRHSSLVMLISFILVALVILSLFLTKGDFQSGVYESEKILLFVLAFVCGSSILLDESISKGVVISSLIVSTVGLIAYCGFCGVSELVLLSDGVPRLQSLFKYANTTACYLSCGYIFALNEYIKSGKKQYLFISQILSVSLFLTFSKAMIPIFVLGIFAFALFNKKTLCKITSQTILSLVFCLLVALSSANDRYILSFVLICICIVLGGTVTFLKSNKIAFALWISGVVSGLFLIIGISFLKPSLFSTFSQRLGYMSDAIKLIPGRLVFGNGPGSFQILQHPIQYTQYDVKYVHNSFLQFLVENGIVFTLILLAVTVFSIYRFIKQKKYTFLVCTIFIVLHSLVDFDLSYGAVMVLFGFLLSIAFNGVTLNIGFIRGAFALALSAICIFTLTYMLSEYIMRSSFENKVIASSYEDAIDNAEALEKICPRDSKLQISIASLISKTDNNREEILQRIDKARILSPYDTDIFEAYISYNMTKDNLEGLCFDYIKLKPKHEMTYEKVKLFVEKAYELSIIDSDEKEGLTKAIDDYRVKQKVYDRNEYLDRIMKRGIQ